LTISLEIGAAGDVQRARPLLDRIASKEHADLDAIRARAAERLSNVCFPPAETPTKANVPLIF
jgi:hypothetical protein